MKKIYETSVITNAETSEEFNIYYYAIPNGEIYLFLMVPVVDQSKTKHFGVETFKVFKINDYIYDFTTKVLQVPDKKPDKGLDVAILKDLPINFNKTPDYELYSCDTIKNAEIALKNILINQDLDTYRLINELKKVSH